MGVSGGRWCRRDGGGGGCGREYCWLSTKRKIMSIWCVGAVQGGGGGNVIRRSEPDKKKVQEVSKEYKKKGTARQIPPQILLFLGGGGPVSAASHSTLQKMNTHSRVSLSPKKAFISPPSSRGWGGRVGKRRGAGERRVGCSFLFWERVEKRDHGLCAVVVCLFCSFSF